MKGIIFGIAVLLLGFGFFLLNSNRAENTKEVSSTKITPTTSQVLSSVNSKEQTALFVPYWALTQERIPESFGDQLMYFGIAPGKDGIDKGESGYLGLARFSAIAEGRETLLVLRMLNQNNSFAILKDQKLQEDIISETLALAKQYKFKGVVLDLEVSSLPFATVTDQIDRFVEKFVKAAKKENLTLSMMFFGDTFYRLRSYDVVVLEKMLDRVIVMAYDLHKANGEPGPSFPLHGKETYGYDFTVMVNDFLNIVSAGKLTIVFGMFGYDWTLDKDKKPVKTAESLSFYQIKSKFLDSCAFLNCTVLRDEKSQETQVQYHDDKGNSHVVWFEDMESVAKKQEYLTEKNINAIGFWAYSYF